jgi:hypothetical protein
MERRAQTDGGSRVPLRALVVALGLAQSVGGCSSPEDGRPRGGGRGGDGANYAPGSIHVPSKLDGTRAWTAQPKA